MIDYPALVTHQLFYFFFFFFLCFLFGFMPVFRSPIFASLVATDMFPVDKQFLIYPIRNHQLRIISRMKYKIDPRPFTLRKFISTHICYPEKNWFAMIYITYVAPMPANNSFDLSFEFCRFHFLPKSLPSPPRNWQNKLPPERISAWLATPL